MLVLALIGFLATAGAVDIVKTKSAYKDIYVGIHNDIPEDLKLIEQIKTLFTSGSAFLFNATHKRAHFGSVTIVIPSSWSKITNDVIYSDGYAEAHVKIANPNPEFGDDPYTLQPLGCGEQGSYIHLTPKFIMDESGRSTEMYGDLGRQLVHEWAHFRYGVFDEHGKAGDPKYPMVYSRNGKIYPSSCVANVVGWIEQEDAEPCVMYDNGEVGVGCTFIPDLDSNNDIKASIMYMPYRPQALEFCDNSDSGNKHDPWAPTPQNDKCDRKSTWEVIAANKDFSGVNGQPDTSVTDTKPVFRVVRKGEAPDRRTALVMDVSGSMSSYNRIQNLGTAATALISDIIPDQSSLAMITFSSGPTVVKHLTKITSRAVRNDLLAAIPRSAGGGTEIGKAIQAAIQELGRNGQSTEGCMILLLTDGEESGSYPTVKDVTGQAVNSKVIINSVAIGTQASSSLETISLATGGGVFNVLDTSSATEQLKEAFSTVVTKQADVELQPVTVSNDDIKLTRGQTYSKNVQMEKEIGKNSVFTISAAQSLGNVEVELVSPSGKRYNRNSPEYDGDVNVKNRILFTFPKAEAGKWKVVLTSSADTTVTFKMTSEALDPKEQPIRVESWYGQTEVTNPTVKVFARVMKGQRAVIGATVEGLVTTPNGGISYMTLKDKGVGSDIVKDDGIYTGTFNALNTMGRYSTRIKVINDGNARIKIGTPGSGAPRKLQRKSKSNAPSKQVFELKDFWAVPELPPEHPPVPSEPADEFTRDVNAGAFRLVVNPSTFSVDRTPPSRIADLEMVPDYNIFTNVSVTLKWTSTGDDVDVGTAKTYEIRSSRNPDDLLKSWSQSHLFSGVVAPLAAGTTQTVVLVLPEILLKPLDPSSSTFDVYFGIKAIDAAGNVSPLSNLVTFHHGYNAPPCKDPTKMFYPHETDCRKFYHCSHTTAYLKNCPATLHWSIKASTCDWPCVGQMCDKRFKCGL